MGLPLGSELFTNLEGHPAVELSARVPAHPDPGIELELVDQQRVHADPGRIRARERLPVPDAIDDSVRRSVVEDAQLEDVAHERIAELEEEAGRLSRVLGAEG